ncbi:hypothetical protein BC6307_07295 [Sutcliffiella cohnii]|uniref:Uncharacterized protein n=1 Tax=Sutcliffiella cohnii TaxID=33932 RepID=A0A223KNX6_9BACI|nr:hypothetical protein [Sutcliffiella cohnii]AST91097.1 hypothetical protein BC6307_07295 [Sutcliffiella cohnii]
MGKQKKWLYIVVGLLLVTVFFLYINNKDENHIVNHHAFGSFYIEEKDYHIEPGEYMEMWIDGYNDAEKEENRVYFRVYIKDANVFNLIEKEKVYFLTFSNEDDLNRYYLDQISPPGGENLTGEGR